MRGFLLMVLLASAAGYLFLSTASRSAWLCCAGAGLIVVANLVHLLRGDADLGARAARRRLETQLANGGGEAKHLFAGKVFWVVGASSGIGAATAKVAAACGAKLILSARREAKLRKVAAECERAGAADVSVVPLDVTEFASHKAVVERVLKQANQIDILFNNAGQSQRTLAEECELGVDEHLMRLNVLGPMSVTKQVLPHMLQRRQGHIVVTSSVAGKLGAPCSSTYSATKHAVQGFFNSLRMEVCDRNVQVTMVCPGPVLTDGQANAATGTVGKIVGQPADPKKEKRMSAEDCAKYIVAAIVDGLDEVWLSPQPILAFLYIYQFFPSLAAVLSKRIGPKRVAAYRGGDSGYKMFNLGTFLKTLVGGKAKAQ